MLKLSVFYITRWSKSAWPWLVCLPDNLPPVLWSGLKAFSLALPPAVLGFVSFDFPVGMAPPIQVSLIGIFARHIILLWGVLLSPLAMMLAFDFWEHCSRKRRTRDAPDQKEAAAVLTALDNIVSLKMRRISGSNSVDRAVKQKAATVLNTLAQPQVQIEEILTQIYYTLKTVLRGDDSLRVVLVRISDGLPQAGAIYRPSESRSSEELLKISPRKTMFFEAANERKTQLIADIEAHLKLSKSKDRIYHPSSRLDDKGSIVCFPLIHPQTDKVVFCLSFKSNVPGTFTRTNLSKMETIAAFFMRRILLEHTLSSILEVTDLS